MPAHKLSFLPLQGLPEVEAGADLAALLANCIDESGLELHAGDVIAIAQKIVSKAENRFVDLADVTPSAEALGLRYSRDKDPRLAELILRESQR